MGTYIKTAGVILVCFYFAYYATTYTEWHFIDNANLIFHEAGHVIFSFFGEYAQIAAGSIFQVALPFFISLYFFFHAQKISAALCLLWVGQNLLNVSVYAGDAELMALPLLGGDSVNHDWNFLLGTTGLLDQTAFIAGSIYAVGILTMIVGGVSAILFASQKRLE